MMVLAVTLIQDESSEIPIGDGENAFWLKARWMHRPRMQIKACVSKGVMPSRQAWIGARQSESYAAQLLI